MRTHMHGPEIRQLLLDAAADGGRAAANALTRWSGRYVRIDTEGFSVVPAASIRASMLETRGLVVAVRLAVTGDFAEQAMLWLPLESAEYVAAGLLGLSDLPDLRRDESARSCVLRLGGIMAGAYLTGLGTWLGVAVVPASPQMVLDMPAAVLQTWLGQSGADDLVLTSRADLCLDDVSIRWSMCIRPESPSMRAILSKYGVSEGKATLPAGSAEIFA